MAVINTTDLTTGSVTGAGVFDQLMRSVKAHLKEEFDSSRISGSDYATVYLGSLQSVLEQSANFLLQRQISDHQAELLAQQTLNASDQNSTILSQTGKSDAEIALLAQKLLTEKAQILDVVDGNSVAGLIGKQNTLYGRQSDGFLRDAEQKLLKTMVDTWTIRRSTDEGTVADASNGLHDANILAAVNKAKTGVGM